MSSQDQSNNTLADRTQAERFDVANRLFLRRAQGMTVKQLVAFLMVSRQNLAAVLDRLEAAGLVGRTRIEGDGRLRHVTLTAQGEATWRAMQHDIGAYYSAALAPFSTEEAVILFRLLDRLRGSLAQIDTAP